MKHSFGTSPMFLLTLLFITLKLTKVIAWSWWWVLSPVILALILLAIWATLEVIAEEKKRRYWRGER